MRNPDRRCQCTPFVCNFQSVGNRLIESLKPPKQCIARDIDLPGISNVQSFQALDTPREVFTLLINSICNYGSAFMVRGRH